MTDDVIEKKLVPLAAELVQPPFGNNRACRGEDTERFFPAPRQPYETTWAAKAICKGSDERPPCPVLGECLLYALHNRVDGIWGGTEPHERTKLRKRLNIRARQVSFTNANRHRRQAS